MFADDIKLVAYAVDKYAIPEGPCIDIGGTQVAVVADYSKTLAAIEADVEEPEAQFARISQEVWPLRYAFRLALPEEYTVEDPQYGGAAIRDLGAKWGRTFAIAACLNVLEHTRRPWDDAKAIARCMVSGGLLVVSVPWMFPDHPSPEDNWRFSPQALMELFDTDEWTVLEHGKRLDIPTDAGIRCLRTGAPQGITTSYLIARAR